MRRRPRRGARPAWCSPPWTDDAGRGDPRRRRRGDQVADERAALRRRITLSGTERPSYVRGDRHHLGIAVDDLMLVCRAVERRGAFDRDAFGHHLVEVPGDVVQLCVRDPVGNLVEFDHPGAGRLPDDVRAELKGLWEINPQSDEQMRGRLSLPE